jgi:hypothetical protein
MDALPGVSGFFRGEDQRRELVSPQQGEAAVRPPLRIQGMPISSNKPM